MMWASVSISLCVHLCVWLSVYLSVCCCVCVCTFACDMSVSCMCVRLCAGVCLCTWACLSMCMCGQDILSLFKRAIQVSFLKWHTPESVHLFPKLRGRPESRPRGPERQRLLVSPSRPQVDRSELKLLHSPTRLASSALGITLKPRHAGGQGTKSQARFQFWKLGSLFSNFLEGGGIRHGRERSWTRQAGHFSTLGSPSLAPRTLEFAFYLGLSALAQALCGEGALT